MRRPQRAFLALLIILVAASLPTAVALAQLPQFPNTFFGDVTKDDGQPAPLGVVVTAVVDLGILGSEKRYSLVVTEPGKYGAANGPKLKVGGDLQGPISDGSTIQFFLSAGALPADVSGLEPVAEASFFDDGEPHNTRLNLTGTILGNTDTATPTPTPAPTATPTPTSTSTPLPLDTSPTPTPAGDDNDSDNDNNNGSGPVPTFTPQPTTPTGSSQGGGGGQPVPTATPLPVVPTAEPQEPTPVLVVVAPPQLPTATAVPTSTPEPTATQPVARPTLEAPTPTVSLEIDEPIAGGGGEKGGFPWWGWGLIVLGVGAVASGAAIYYLRF